METTLEKLYSHYSASASIIPYQDWVIIAYQDHKGVSVDIFETADSLEDFMNFERRFNRIYQKEGKLEDQGYVVKWVFETLGA